MRMMTVMASLAVAALGMAFAAAGQDGGRLGRIEVGERFPDLTLPDLDGAARSLAELRGQKVVLHVFASW